MATSSRGDTASEDSVLVFGQLPRIGMTQRGTAFRSAPFPFHESSQTIGNVENIAQLGEISRQQAARGLAEMLQSTRLRSTGREKQRKQDDNELTSSPIFTSFVRPCAAEFLGTIIYVYFSEFWFSVNLQLMIITC